VNYIGKSCFTDCSRLSELYFEADSALKEIDEEAFSHTNLKEIPFPKSLERLDGSALVDLDTVKIEADSTSLLFAGDILCDGTRTVIVRNFCRESSIIIDTFY
jgi:hypothetical protein